MVDSAYWWAFVVLSPVVYWLLPRAIRASVLSAASFALLLYFAPADIAALAVLAGLVYFAHGLPEGRTGALGWVSKIGRSSLPLWVVIAYFVWSKYLPSLLLALGHQASFLDLAIPLGISYFTFKLLHYSIERGRDRLPDHRFADFASYMFLPQIFSAGPIERFDHYMDNRAPEFEWSHIQEGLLRIAQGLVMKFVIATSLSTLVNRLAGGTYAMLATNAAEIEVWRIWVTLFMDLAYTYFDFAGYSAIAIGSARLLGFRIMENFNLPFLATSLQNFWQRWHMTLAAWVLAYVYMPIVGATRNPYLAIIAAFFVVGIWHAAWPLHWVIWGLWHGIGLAVLIWWTRLFQKRRSQFLKRPWVKGAGWAMTMFYVAMGDVFPAFYTRGPLSDPVIVLGAAIGIR